MLNPLKASIIPHIERRVHAARNPIEQMKTVFRIMWSRTSAAPYRCETGPSPQENCHGMMVVATYHAFR
jgi:hypothetical protein